ncbi:MULTISPECIES: hypothetical protein [Streptococcus]|uniref:hypothetical protein n=1 Tax=Streptococcus TaxID=1301 RepID=UPI0012DEBFED|nr:MULTISPECIES: hypothetical protein [Streptococcus]QHF55439.1 hypothetical protein BZG42_08840 [Streptococcus sp. DAT741]
MDKLKDKVNGVYGWNIRNGKVVPPIHNLPDTVKQRADYFWDMAEDGMSFMGCMECIFADEKPEYFDFGATKDWLPKTKDFDEWVDFALGMAQMEIAVYLIYGNPKEVE